MSGNSRPLRVGIISANWGALAHLPAWRMIDGIEVTAICTSRQETAVAAASRFGVERSFWDYEAMCADPAIDIIDAGTSPLLREAMVAAALRGGKHVVNQVPFAASLAGAETLVRLQGESGQCGAVAASILGLPHLALMKEMIDAGFLGDVLQVHCSWQMSFFLRIPPGFNYTWFGKAGNGTSVTRNQGSHMLHALVHLFGPVASLSARLETRLPEWNLPDGSTMKVETDDTCHALLDFESGAMGTLNTSWTAADAPGFFIDAFGSKGRLRLQGLRYPSIDTAELYAANAQVAHQPIGSRVPLPERLLEVDGRPHAPGNLDLYNGGQRLSLARLFAAFTGAIRSGRKVEADFMRGLQIQRIIEAMYRSNERRATEPVS